MSRQFVRIICLCLGIWLVCAGIVQAQPSDRNTREGNDNRVREQKTEQLPKSYIRSRVSVSPTPSSETTSQTRQRANNLDRLRRQKAQRQLQPEAASAVIRKPSVVTKPLKVAPEEKQKQPTTDLFPIYNPDSSSVPDKEDANLEQQVPPAPDPFEVHFNARRDKKKKMVSVRKPWGAAKEKAKILGPSLDVNKEGLDVDKEEQEKLHALLQIENLSYARKEIIKSEIENIERREYQRKLEEKWYAGPGDALYPYPISGANGPLLDIREFLLDTPHLRSGEALRTWLEQLNKLTEKIESTRSVFLELASSDELPPNFVIFSAISRLTRAIALPASEWPEPGWLKEKILDESKISTREKIDALNEVIEYINGPVKLALERLVLDLEAIHFMASVKYGNAKDDLSFYPQMVGDRLLPGQSLMDLHIWIKDRLNRHEKELDALASIVFRFDEDVQLKRPQLFRMIEEAFGETYLTGPINQQSFLGLLENRERENRKYIRGIYQYRAPDRIWFKVGAFSDSYCPVPQYRYRPASKSGDKRAIIEFDIDCLTKIAKAELPILVASLGSLGMHGRYSMQMRESDAEFRELNQNHDKNKAWRIYASQVAFDRNLLGKRPATKLYYHMRQIQLLSASFADLSLNIGEWTRQDAENYLVETLGYSNKEARAKVIEMISAPARDVHIVAELFQIHALKGHLKAKLGSKYSDKIFHATHILGGDLSPLLMLERFNHLVKNRLNENSSSYLSYKLEKPEAHVKASLAAAQAALSKPKITRSKTEKRIVLVFENGVWVRKEIEVPVRPRNENTVIRTSRVTPVTGSTSYERTRVGSSPIRLQPSPHRGSKSSNTNPSRPNGQE